MILKPDVENRQLVDMGDFPIVLVRQANGLR